METHCFSPPESVDPPAPDKAPAPPAGGKEDMALLDINREAPHQAVYEETLSLYREALLDYLFGK